MELEYKQQKAFDLCSYTDCELEFDHHNHEQRTTLRGMPSLSSLDKPIHAPNFLLSSTCNKSILCSAQLHVDLLTDSI
jgi:hypothetical protein